MHLQCYKKVMALGIGNLKNEETRIIADLEKFGITAKHIDYFKKMDKPLADVLHELTILKAYKEGQIDYPSVVSSATFDNGFLKRISHDDFTGLLKYYDDVVTQTASPTAFIPAAGAASRQFQVMKVVIGKNFDDCKTPEEILTKVTQLIDKLNAIPAAERTDEDKAALKELKDVKSYMMDGWEKGIVGRKFAFVDDLETLLASKGIKLQDLIDKKDIKTVFHYILSEKEGLKYEFLPKALLKFHSYTNPDGSVDNRTAFEEHLRMNMIVDSGMGKVNLHLAISSEHEKYFMDELKTIVSKPGFMQLMQSNGFKPGELVIDTVNKKATFGDLKISWDFQASSTDSVALNIATGKMALNDDGSPLTRKAGHGALLPNMNTVKDGLWFQNIDNILYENPKVVQMVTEYKKVMAAMAYQLQGTAHGFINQLIEMQKSGVVDESVISKTLAFIKNDLTIELPADIAAKDSNALIKDLIGLLDRPIMVSGFVPLKEGQKGGGPFVIEKDYNGIKVRGTNVLEGSEFNGGQNNPTFADGIAFNPVNNFMTVNRYDGTQFDLSTFVDPTRSFVSEKPDKQGNLMYVYERPGLWNGSLAGVIQVSIGLPSSTFGAVKTTEGPESFLSLLHQPYEGDVVTDLDRARGIITDQHLIDHFENGANPK